MNAREKLYYTLNVCIVGEPNSGKSTLLNKLINKKVSIVSRKPQTTLERQSGTLHLKKKQIIFYDTPGIFSKKDFISKGTFKEASYAISETDLALLVIDLRNIDKKRIIKLVSHLDYYSKKFLFILNKTDLFKEKKILEGINLINNYNPNTDIFPISALKNKGIIKLRNFLFNYKGFNKKQNLKYNIKYDNSVFLKEVIREKVLNNIHDEIPYNLKVTIEKVRIKNDKSVEVKSNIIVAKPSYKPIIIGKNGENIKKISISARKELESIFKRKYHLYLFIKILKKVKKK